MPSKYTYPQLLDANVFARKAADSFYWQCTTRTVQESKLFPVNPYIALSYLNAWYRWPELLRKIDAAMPAEEIGDRARNVGSYVSTITMGADPAVLPRGPPDPDRHGHAPADGRPRRRDVRPRLRAPREHGVPPQPRAHVRERREPARADPHRAAGAGLRGRRDRSQARGQAAHRARALHGDRVRLRLPQPLRVPAELQQPRPVQDGGRRDDRPRPDRPRRVRLPLDGRRGGGARAQQPDRAGGHEGHALPHRRRLGQLRGRRRPTTPRTSSPSACTRPTTCPTATSRCTWTRPPSWPTTSTTCATR